jgi:NitT/TauT family transport system permease protein
MSETEQVMNQRTEIKAAKRLPAFNWRFSDFNWRGLIAVGGFFLLWELAVRLGLAGFAQIPSPVEVTQVFFRDYLFDPNYWHSWWASFQRVFYGFVIAQLIGIPLGLLLGTRQNLSYLLYPVIEILRPIPPLAWVPLSILFWPTSESSIVFITFIGAFFIIVINVYDAVCGIKKEHLWLAQSVGAGPVQIFRHIVIPSVIPSIAVGMTLGIAVTWNVVIAAEMIASDSGLGRLTWEGYVSQTGPVVVIGMISIGIAGYVSTLMVDYVEKRMMPWKRVH